MPGSVNVSSSEKSSGKLPFHHVQSVSLISTLTLTHSLTESLERQVTIKTNLESESDPFCGLSSWNLCTSNVSGLPSLVPSEPTNAVWNRHLASSVRTPIPTSLYNRTRISPSISTLMLIRKLPSRRVYFLSSPFETL